MFIETQGNTPAGRDKIANRAPGFSFDHQLRRMAFVLQEIVPIRCAPLDKDLLLAHRRLIEPGEIRYIVNRRLADLKGARCVRGCIGNAPSRQRRQWGVIKGVTVAILTVVVGDTLNDREVEAACGHDPVKVFDLFAHQPTLPVDRIGYDHLQHGNVEFNPVQLAAPRQQTCGGDRRAGRFINHQPIVGMCRRWVMTEQARDNVALVGHPGAQVNITLHVSRGTDRT